MPGDTLACYVEKNPSGESRTQVLAIYRFAENNPNLTSTRSSRRQTALSRVIDAHYDDFHKWLNDARQYAISQDMNVIQGAWRGMPHVRVRGQPPDQLLEHTYYRVVQHYK